MTFKSIDTFIDIVFVIDIILMFFTSVINKHGHETFDSVEIRKIYVSKFRFYADVLSVLGSGIFQNINQFFSLFGLFKVIRVFRIGPMIAKSNVDERTKGVLNLTKLIFYLYFYLHCLSCYFWLALGFQSPTRFYADVEKGFYFSSSGKIAMDANGDPIPYDEAISLRFGESRTFGDDKDWLRFTSENSPDWEEVNEMWESRKSIWYMPLDWVNFEEEQLFIHERDQFYRYTVLLYQALLNLGMNEFGPVNEVEFMYLGVTLAVSAILNALIFGDIAGIIAKLNKQKLEEQELLDKSNTIMKNIELSAEDQDQIRAFFQLTQHSRQKNAALDKFLSMLASSLKIKIQSAIFLKILVNNKNIIKVMLFILRAYFQEIKRQKKMRGKNVFINRRKSSTQELMDRLKNKLKKKVTLQLPPKLRLKKLTRVIQVNDFLEQLVQRLGILFASPEEMVIR